MKYPGEISLSSDAMLLETTNKGEFSPRREINRIDKRQPIKPTGELSISKEPLDSITTNKGDFRYTHFTSVKIVSHHL